MKEQQILLEDNDFICYREHSKFPKLYILRKNIFPKCPNCKFPEFQLSQNANSIHLTLPKALIFRISNRLKHKFSKIQKKNRVSRRNLALVSKLSTHTYRSTLRPLIIWTASNMKFLWKICCTAQGRRPCTDGQIITKNWY